MGRYEITTRDASLRLYTLRDDESGAWAEVCPERGGIVTRFATPRKNVLYLNEDTLTDVSHNVWGGIPVLFPICSYLTDDQYRWGDKTYHMPIHGFGRHLPWQATDIDVADGAALTVTLRDSALTQFMFPFAFRAEITYRLKGERLSLEQRYVNLSDGDMPLQYGFHPFFDVSTKGMDLFYKTDAAAVTDMRDWKTRPFDGHMDMTHDPYCKFLEGCRHISLVDPADGLEVALDYDDSFTRVLVWSGDGGMFCVEPWSAGIDALNTGEGLLRVAPGARHEAHFAIEVRG